MKKFKKALSFILTLSLAITSPVLVAAEESGGTETKFADTITYTDIVAGTPQAVTLAETDSCLYYRFVPEQTGEYVIYSASNGEDDDPYVEIYDTEGNCVYQDDDGSIDLNFELGCDLQAEVEYFIRVASYSNTASYLLYVEQKKSFADLKKDSIKLTLAEGQNQSDKITVTTEDKIMAIYDKLIAFTPTESGHYTFVVQYSYYAKNLVMLSADGVVCSNMETKNDDDYCYYIQGYLTGGTTYYVGMEYPTSYSNGDNSFKAWVTKEKTVTDMQVELVSENAALVYGRGGSWECYDDGEESIDYYCYEREDILDLFKITLIYDDNTTEVWDGCSGGRVTYKHSYEAQAAWSVGGDNNLITLIADNCSQQVNVPIVEAPTATNLEITLKTPDSYLVYGRDGEWYTDYEDDMGNEVGYFHFNTSKARSLFYAKVTYENGTYDEGDASELCNKDIIKCSQRQNANNPWVIGGTDNTLTFTAGECSQSVNVPVVELAVESLAVEIAEQNTYLYYGSDDCGWWDEYYDSTTDSYKEYFDYNDGSMRKLFNIKIVYENGEIIEGNLNKIFNEYVDSQYIRYETNHSETNPWLPGEGTHTLTVTVDGKSVNVEVPIRESAVTDFVPVESVSFGQDLTVTVDESRNFTPVFAPANATLENIYWETEDAGIAQVSKEMTDGKITVTGLKEEGTNITAYAANGARLAVFTVTVTKKQNVENGNTDTDNTDTNNTDTNNTDTNNTDTNDTESNSNATSTKEIGTVKLSVKSVTYNGKKQTPAVVVKDKAGNILDKSNYKVKYSKNKSVGVATVKVTGVGNCTGTQVKTFKIVPKGTKISKISSQKKGLSLKWKKQTKEVSGYEIQYSTKKSFKGAKVKKITKAKTTSIKITKLTAKKKYYVRIRTYKTVKVNGKTTKVYSAWSSTKCIKTK